MSSAHVLHRLQFQTAHCKAAHDSQQAQHLQMQATRKAAHLCLKFMSTQWWSAGVLQAAASDLLQKEREARRREVAVCNTLQQEEGRKHAQELAELRAQLRRAEVGGRPDPSVGASFA